MSWIRYRSNRLEVNADAPEPLVATVRQLKNMGIPDEYRPWAMRAVSGAQLVLDVIDEVAVAILHAIIWAAYKGTDSIRIFAAESGSVNVSASFSAVTRTA